MDLRAMKEKLALSIKSAEYRVGVDDFMVYDTRSLTSSDGKLRCPCIKCVNNKLLSPDDVNYHLLHFGIMRNYNNWMFHGEVADEISFEPMVENETKGETNLHSNGVRRRGKTLLADVWNLPPGHQIMIDVNKEIQPIGEEARVLGYFCGTIARNGKLCSLTYTRWDHLKKGGNKNNEAMILKEVKARFLYPDSLEKWILKSIGLRWKDYKCYLKGRYYDDDIDINIVQDRGPSDVEKDQWISLVSFRRSEEEKKRSKRGKESLINAKVKPISATGTKSHARVREELNQIKSIVAEQGDKEMNLDDDPVSKVLGKDQYGRVRGLGLGAKPSNVAKISAPPYCKSLNLSSRDERRVKCQDTTVKKLKSKLQSQFGSDFDDSDSDNSDLGSSDFDEDDNFNIHTVDKVGCRLRKMRDNVLWERTWRLEYPEIRLTTKEKGAIVATVEKNQSMQLDFNRKVDGRNLDEENLESNDKSIDEWIRQAKSFPKEVCNDGHHGGSIISDAPQ
ncbi:Ribonuclease Z, partial [Bienertia sinuspersici]